MIPPFYQFLYIALSAGGFTYIISTAFRLGISEKLRFFFASMILSITPVMFYQATNDSFNDYIGYVLYFVFLPFFYYILIALLKSQVVIGEQGKGLSEKSPS